ncbi:MAG: chromate transporter [Burkholderiaceae bacterium]|nr:chromate transporter [Burkholderiaceae bacterium]
MTPATDARPRPASLWALFRAFNALALQGFGGVLAVAQRELVERHRWLSREEFLEMFGVAQVMPGPNVVNLSLMIGERFFGLRGAFTALMGMFLMPCLIVLTLATISDQFVNEPRMMGALRGMGAVASGLILSTGIKMVPALRHNAMGQWVSGALSLATIVAIAVLRVPLVEVVLGLGGLGMAWAAWCLRKAAQP